MVVSSQCAGLVVPAEDQLSGLVGGDHRASDGQDDDCNHEKVHLKALGCLRVQDDQHEGDRDRGACQPNASNDNPQGEPQSPNQAPYQPPMQQYVADASSQPSSVTPDPVSPVQVPQNPSFNQQPQFAASSPQVTSQPTPQHQPPQQPDQGEYATSKDLKMINFLGKAIVIVASIGLVSSLLDILSSSSVGSTVGAAFVFSVVELLIGIGILKFNKAAHIAFRVFGVFAIIMAMFMLPGFFMALVALPLIFLMSPLAGLLTLVGVTTQTLLVALVIYGFFLLGKRRVRALYFKKA